MKGRRGAGVAVVLGLLASVTACDREPEFGLAPEGEAAVRTQAYYEYDGAPGQGGRDAVAPGLRFEVLLPGSERVVASGAAASNGLVLLGDIPVGTYDLRVDPGYLADTLMVTGLDTTRVTLSVGDTVTIRAGVTPLTQSIADVRTLPEGRRVWIQGMALNSRASSVDGAVHVREAGVGALRVLFPAATGGAPGDSVRVLGLTQGIGSRRVLTDGLLTTLASSVRPVLPMEVDLETARTAGNGDLDADLVIVRGGTVTDVVSVPFVGFLLTVEDAGESVDVLLPLQNGFGGAAVQPGMPVVSITGLLVPDPEPSSTWRIVPRNGGDVQFGPAPPGG